ncbi:hypothetical protein WME95_06530 [Sorangium sp. So ce327]|jgi:hypothetical protein|uniref:hypothetical protein n=1 Tax=Sorangium sp. So ce327 TaxID=3133301 RepID=UPI003F5E06F7
MSPAIAALPSTLGSSSLTKHAYERMVTRSISRTAIEAAPELGRCVEIRGPQVVVTASGAVMTMCRNSDFRGLRTRRRRSFRR